MVGQASACRRRRVLSVVVGLAFAGTLANSLALSAVAAEPYSPPESLATEPTLGAELPMCAPGPAAYEGEDPVVGELRALRLDQVSTCEALVARLGILAHRLWWVVAQQLTVETSLGSAMEKSLAVDKESLSALESSLPLLKAAATPEVQHTQVDGPEPLPVIDTEVQAATLVGAETTNQDEWAIAGFGTGWILCAFLGWMLVRVVR
jgi:hypothetical protein